MTHYYRLSVGDKGDIDRRLSTHTIYLHSERPISTSLAIHSLTQETAGIRLEEITQREFDREIGEIAENILKERSKRELLKSYESQIIHDLIPEP